MWCQGTFALWRCFFYVCLQISPRMACLRKCKIMLNLFVWPFLHCSFSNVLSNWPAWDKAYLHWLHLWAILSLLDPGGPGCFDQLGNFKGFLKSWNRKGIVIKKSHEEKRKRIFLTSTFWKLWQERELKIRFSRAREKLSSHFFSRFFEIETLVNDCCRCGTTLPTY